MSADKRDGQPEVDEGNDTDEIDYRDRYWFQVPIRPENARFVGGSMIRAIAIWFAILMALAVVASVWTALA